VFASFTATLVTTAAAVLPLSLSLQAETLRGCAQLCLLDLGNNSIQDSGSISVRAPNLLRLLFLLFLFLISFFFWVEFLNQLQSWCDTH
jgi:hypothetical protein